MHHTAPFSRFKLKRYREYGYGYQYDDEDENTSEVTFTNEENEPIIDLKREKKKSVVFQQILNNNRTAYSSANYKKIFINSFERR